MTTKPRIRIMHIQPSSQAWGDTAHCQPGPTTYPVLVIPLDPATLAKITDKMACAIHNSMHENCVEWGKLQPGSGYYNDAMIQARAALRAVSPHLRRKA